MAKSFDIENFLEKIYGAIRAFVARLSTSILKILFAFLLIHILLIFIWFISAKEAKDQFDTCYDEGLSISQQAGISAYFEKTENYKFNNSSLPTDAEMKQYFSANSTAKPSESNNQWIKNYGQDQFSQFLTPEEKKMSKTTFTLNGEPIKVKIKGKWSPWFGELSEANRKAVLQSNVKQQFYCSLEKRTLTGANKYTQLVDKADENVFYYIENYNDFYGIYTDTEKNKKNMVMRVKQAEYQEPCWVTRGAGLYLGVFGLTGKTTPTEYYHLIAQKMECPIKTWFNGKKMQDRTVLTDSYTYSDFKKNYFSLEYYLEQRNRNDIATKLTTEDKEKARKILTIVDDAKVVFDIDLLETLLIKYGVQNVGYIVANAMSRFNYACYTEEKGADGGMERTTDNAYFIYGPKEIRRQFATYTEKFKYGEEARFFILDRNYNDNIGQYNIDVLSGLEYDTKGSITSKLQDLEFTLLGTPRPNQKNDRDDGLVAKIFSNIIQSGFVKILRACLVLAVMFFGFRTIMGYGWNNKAVRYSEHFRKLFVYKEFMTVCLRMCIALALTTETGFQLFNKTFINFVVNGTIGLIDLIASFYGQSLMQSNNLFFLTGGLERASSVLSLSRNFAILDEIFAMLTDKVILYKILSLYFTKDFFFSVIGIVLMAYIIFKYVLVLIKSVVPFAFVLLQWTIALPLAPFMLLFGLFKRTEDKLMNWITFCVSKSFELIAFFLSFYFWTGLINNQIQQLLNFKVCIRRLNKFLFGGINGVDTANTIIGFATAGIILSAIAAAGYGLAPGLVTAVIFIAIVIIFYACSSTIPYYEKQGATDGSGMVILGIGNSAFYKQFLNLKNGSGFVVECLLAIIMISMFDTITKGIMDIAGNIFVYNKAKADLKGGAMANTSNFSVDNQFGQFGDETGIANLQAGADKLHWSRTFMNFRDKAGNRGKVSDNILNTAKFFADNKATRSLFGGLEAKIAGKAKDGDREMTLKEAIKDQWEKEQSSEFTQGAVGLIKGVATGADNIITGGRVGQKISDKQALNIDKNLTSARNASMQENPDKTPGFRKSADLRRTNLSRDLISMDRFMPSSDNDSGLVINTQEGTKELVTELNTIFNELGKDKVKHGGFFGRRHNNITRKDLEFINDRLKKLGIKKFNGKEFNEYDLYNLRTQGVGYLLKEFNVNGASAPTDYINKQYYMDKQGRYNIDSTKLYTRSAADPNKFVRAINDKGQMLFLDREGKEAITIRNIDGRAVAYDSNGKEVYIKGLDAQRDKEYETRKQRIPDNKQAVERTLAEPKQAFDANGNLVDLAKVRDTALSGRDQHFFIDKDGKEAITIRNIDGRAVAYDSNGKEVYIKGLDLEKDRKYNLERETQENKKDEDKQRETENREHEDLIPQAEEKQVEEVKTTDEEVVEPTAIFDAGGNPVELFNAGSTISLFDSDGNPANVFDTGGNTIDLVDMAKDVNVVEEVSKIEQAKIDAEKARQLAEKKKKQDEAYAELKKKDEEEKNN